MKISILKLVPKNWIIKYLGDKISVTYETKYRYKPHPVIFPKVIDIDENFIEAMALYLGDGSFQKNKHHATFTNKDKDVCKFMWNFFCKRFGLTTEDVSCEIRYRSKKPIISEWSKELDIPKEAFKLRYYVRNRDETFHLQINRTIFRQIFESITKKVTDTNFIENKALRQAFLRGLFAAEGSMGVMKDSPKPYLNYVSYHLSIYEEKLAYLIANALDLENIRHTIFRREKDHSIVVRITGWDNYWKLWRAKTFELCGRKKTKFLNVARELEINCLLSESFRAKLFSKIRISQKELAKQLNSWQGNVSKMINGELGITLNRLLILSKLSGIDQEEIKGHVENVAVGRLTTIYDKGFVDLILDLKTD